jgi:hypothetical protein
VFAILRNLQAGLKQTEIMFSAVILMIDLAAPHHETDPVLNREPRHDLFNLTQPCESRLLCSLLEMKGEGDGKINRRWGFCFLGPGLLLAPPAPSQQGQMSGGHGWGEV